MVRAAAKNHAHVGVVVDPGRLRAGARRAARDGRLSAPTRRRLARAAFARTAAYDAAIVDWLDGLGRRRTPARRGAAAAGDAAPRPRAGPAAALRREPAPASRPATASRGRRAGGTPPMQHGGKELSYLNLYDTEAAWRLVHRFAEPACVIVKHANPCGVAVADDITTAYGGPTRAIRSARSAASSPSTGRCPRAGRGAGPGVHRGRRRARLRRRRAGDADGEDEPARAVAPSRRARRALDMRHDRRRAARADARPGRRSTGRAWRVVTDAEPTRRAVGRPRVRLAGVRRGQLERDRVRQGPAGVRHRRRPAEPGRLGPHRRRPGRRPGRRRGVRQRRLLPVPRRPRRRRRPPASGP